MKRYKMVLLFLSFAVFILIGLELVRFQNIIHPEKPYTADLRLDDYNAKNEYYVTLNEIKNGTAMIYIKDNGTHLVRPDEEISIDRGGHVLLGPSFRGNVKVLEITDNSAKMHVDIKRTKNFYIINGILGLIICGIFSFLFFHIFYGIGKGIAWSKKQFKKTLHT